MNTMLKEFMDLKEISDANEFFNKIKQKGLDIPPNTFLDDSLTINTPLYSKLEEAAFILAYHTLSFNQQLDVDFEILSKEAKLRASCFYVYFTLPSPKSLYLITKEASAIIASTYLTEKIDILFCTEFLSTPYFIYSSDEAPLFDDVNAIALYFDETKTLTCHIGVTGGMEFVRNIDLSEHGAQFVEKVENGIYGDEYIIEETAKDKLFKATTYIVKFILLLNTEKKPLFVESQYKEKKKPNKAMEKKIFGNISYKKVSLTNSYKKKMRDIDKIQVHKILDQEGKTLRTIHVTGHLRMQAYGPEWSLHRPIYIEAHESKAWRKDGIQIIKVIE